MERYDDVHRKDKVKMIYGLNELNVSPKPFLVRFAVFKWNLCVSTTTMGAKDKCTFGFVQRSEDWGGWAVAVACPLRYFNLLSLVQCVK